MSEKIFDKMNVILVKIEKDDLMSFLVDKDITNSSCRECRTKELIDAVVRTIPEYVFAQYENPEIPQNDAIDKIREAANHLHSVEKFVKSETNREHSGDFGELLLHLLLRDFKGTIPLVSKVYFKDSNNISPHGFDAVHISPEEKILWLGESKFYTEDKRGLSALISDLDEHINKDYLNQQFLIIKKNVESNSIPRRDEWIKILTDCSKLEDKINLINIPMLCTYEHDIYTKFDNLDTREAIEYHESNIFELKSYFDSKNTHKLRDKLNIVLFLFPIINKKEIVNAYTDRLRHLQQI
jgi:hypothetical protein